MATAALPIHTQTTATEFAASEANNLFDATARRYFGISGIEFLQRWDSGEYADPRIRSRAMRVAMLIPMVRPTSARPNSR